MTSTFRLSIMNAIGSAEVYTLQGMDMRIMHRFAVLILVFCLAIPLLAEEAAPQVVTFSPKVKPGEILTYNVRVQASGNAIMPGADKPVPFDTTINVVMSYSVGQPAADGSVQVSLSASKATASLGGEQTMELPASYFPKVVAMLDKTGELTNIFASETEEMKLPGLNSRNLILLFRTYAPSNELKIGSDWKKTLTLPQEQDVYNLTCKLLGLEDVDGFKTAKVRTDLDIIPPDGAGYSAKGFSVSNFTIDGTRLVKSDAEMTVKMKNSGPESPLSGQALNNSGVIDAVVKIQVKLTPTADNKSK